MAALATELVAPREFTVALEHDEQPAPGPAGAGQVAWETSWVLTWEPVSGAAAYAVYDGTSEGLALRQTPRVLDRAELRVEAAAGTSPLDRLDHDRTAGLSFTSSQLLVAVAARTSSGEEGPRSLWFPVGDAPPDGRPIGTEAIGQH